jgi:hypothetical protein
MVSGRQNKLTTLMVVQPITGFPICDAFQIERIVKINDAIGMAICWALSISSKEDTKKTMEGSGVV